MEIMEIYTLIFSTLVCTTVILAFSNKLAKQGLAMLALLFGFDAFYALYLGVDYIRLALDMMVVGAVIIDLLKNWRVPQKNATIFGTIATGTLFTIVGAYSFLQNGSFVYIVLGVTLILIGLWRLVHKQNIKLSTMTKSKQWLILLSITLVESFIAFLCFLSQPSISYFGLVIVAIAWLQWIAAAYLGIKNSK